MLWPATAYRFVLLVRPGLHLSNEGLQRLCDTLEAVQAASPPEPGQRHQWLSREALADRVLLLAYTRDGVLAGYCRATLEHRRAPGDGLVVEPPRVKRDDERESLARILPATLVRRYVLRHRPFSSVWVRHAAPAHADNAPAGLAFPPAPASHAARRVGWTRLVLDWGRHLLRRGSALVAPSVPAGRTLALTPLGQRR